MSTETKNLHLTKPDKDDFYDINIMNENWEKIDEEIEKKATKTHHHDERYSLKSDVGSKQSLATEDKSNVVNAINEVKDVTATVKVTADQANAKATQGKSMAESAQVAADAAKDKAETAQSAAEVAGQKADAAQSAAETAGGKADSAQAKANQASSKAAEAKTKADQAFQLGVEVKEDVVEALNSKKTISDSTTSSAWSSLINKIKGIKEGRGNAQKSHVLSGKTFTNNDGVEYAGTMPNRGTVNANLVNHNQEYTIPAGYHSGAGKIKAAISGLVAGAIKYGAKVGNITGSFTGDANASASHILSGKTAYVRGNKVTGTMANRTGGYNTDSLSKSGNELRMSVPDAGYYSDGAYVKHTDNDWVESNIKAGKNLFGKTGSFTSDATATAGDIQVGKTAYVKGQKIEGTNRYKAGQEVVGLKIKKKRGHDVYVDEDGDYSKMGSKKMCMKYDDMGKMTRLWEVFNVSGYGSGQTKLLIRELDTNTLKSKNSITSDTIVLEERYRVHNFFYDKTSDTLVIVLLLSTNKNGIRVVGYSGNLSFKYNKVPSHDISIFSPQSHNEKFFVGHNSYIYEYNCSDFTKIRTIDISENSTYNIMIKCYDQLIVDNKLRMIAVLREKKSVGSGPYDIAILDYDTGELLYRIMTNNRTYKSCIVRYKDDLLVFGWDGEEIKLKHITEDPVNETNSWRAIKSGRYHSLAWHSAVLIAHDAYTDAVNFLVKGNNNTRYIYTILPNLKTNINDVGELYASCRYSDDIIANSGRVYTNYIDNKGSRIQRNISETIYEL